jgi:hypothetical protein
MGDALDGVGGSQVHDRQARPFAEQNPADPVARAAQDQRAESGIHDGGEERLSVCLCIGTLGVNIRICRP